MSDITKADKVYVSTSKNGDYVSAVDDGDSVAFIRADLAPQWMPIDENTPKDVVLLLGWYGYGDKWDTATDYWHNSRGGWQHGSATHYQIITPPPAT